ncbi:MAG: hypothetical protein ACXVH1_30545 [Solirubrobacteraceae bacterium]
MRWKPIVWNQADHYPQWLTYTTRVGEPPGQGIQLTLPEYPGDTFVASTVESRADPVIVWLEPLQQDWQ